MVTMLGCRVNVIRHFSDGGSQTNEVIVYASSQTASSAEAKARDVYTNVTAVPTELEQRRVTYIDFSYVGAA